MDIPTFSDGHDFSSPLPLNSSKLHYQSIVNRICKKVGIVAADWSLHAEGTNVIIKLNDLALRLDRSSRSYEQVSSQLHLCHWLVAQNFPTIQPLALLENPLPVKDFYATLWKWETGVPERTNSRESGNLLRELHSLVQGYPRPTVEWNPLAQLDYAISLAEPFLTAKDHDLVMIHRNKLEKGLVSLPSGIGSGICHGDWQPKNFLRTGRGLVIGDWEDHGRGPFERDLIPSASGTPGYQEFTKGYGYDVRDWEGWPLLRKMRALGSLVHWVKLPGPQGEIARTQGLRDLHYQEDPLLWTSSKELL